MTTPAPGRAAGRPAVAREDWTFPWYIGGALALAVLGGFLLAVLLPLAAVLDWDWGVRWRALAQAHGHLQVGGWLGLFIAGMAFRLAPRFAGRPLRFAGVTPWALGLLAAGLLGRAVAQPWLDADGMHALLIGSALAELAGALLVAAALCGTLFPAARTLPSAPLMLLGAAGMVAQAAVTAIWLTDIDASYPAIPADRDAALLSIQFFAFLLPFAFGVSLRALPTFFKQPPVSARSAWGITAALGLGTALHAGSRLLAAGAGGVRLQAAGALLVASAGAMVIARTGVWRTPERLRPASRHIVILLRTAYAWLAAAALWLTWDGIAALADGTAPPPAHADGIRHILALGVMTTLVAGMGQLLLPWLALRRQRPGHAFIETWTLWALLTSATVLRVSGSILEARGTGPDRYWPVAAGGVLGLAAVAYFALTVVLAARHPRPEIPVHVREG